MFDCLDCGIDTGSAKSYYMVHDSVWGQGGGGQGMLCPSCLEVRIGRPLTADDFTGCILNRCRVA